MASGNIPLGVRLRAAGLALRGVVRPGATRDALGILQALYPGGRTDPPARNTADYLKAYSEMPWLRAAIFTVSFQVASTDWHLYAVRRGKARKAVRIRSLQYGTGESRRKMMARLKADGDLEEVERHPYLDVLDAGNEQLTGLAVRQLTQVYLDLAGESFWLKERDAMGLTRALWPTPPNWIKDTATRERPFFRIEVGNRNEDVPASEVVWMRYANPTNPYGRGVGTARALADELDTDEYAAKFTRSFFFNRARPDIIVAPREGGVDEPTITRLKERWQQEHGGFWRQFKPFFSSRALDVTTISQDLGQMGLVDLRKHERDTILQVFGVPPEVLGIVENSNRATISGADYIVARFVLTPRLEHLRYEQQQRVVGEYDDRLIIDYDSPIKEDEAAQLDAAKAAPWALMVDEWRSRAGAPELDGDAGKVFMVPPLLVATDDLRSRGGETRSNRGQGERQGEGGKAVRGTKAAEPGELTAEDERARLLRQLESWAHPRYVRAFRAGVRTWRGSVDEAALANALAAGALGTVHDLVARGADSILAGMRDVTQALVELAGGEAAAELRARGLIPTEPPGEFDPESAPVLDWLERHGAEWLAGIEDASTRAAVVLAQRLAASGASATEAARRLIGTLGLTEVQARRVADFHDALVTQGRPAEEIDARVSGLVEGLLRRRADDIAETEANRVANAGQQLLWEQAIQNGWIEWERSFQRWLVVPDDRVCEICEPVPHLEENHRVHVGEAFTLGDGTRISGPPAHPKCRCGLVLDIVD